MDEKIDAKMNTKIGLVLEYYTNFYDVETVQNIVKEIQDIYDVKEPMINEIKPLLEKLYEKIVKNEFHAELLKQILEEI